jgi:Gpi18-like mannosyltransferase
MTYKIKIIIAVILALVLRLYLSTSIYSGDVNNHVAWSLSILKFGSAGAYDRKYVGVMQPTYPPLALYAFTTSYWAYDNVYQAVLFLNNKVSVFPSRMVWLMQNQNVLPAFHKTVSMVSDIGIGILIYLLARKVMKVSQRSAFWAMCLYLFNPAVFYNSTLWGQLESIPVFWVLLSVWLVLNGKWLLGHASFLAALLFKQSSLVFAPAFFLFSVFKTGWKKTFTGLGFQFLLFYLSYLPFFPRQTSTIYYPISTYINRLMTGSGSDYISDHAFNFWALFSHLAKISDNVSFIPGISAGTFAWIIFAVFAVLLISKYLVTAKDIDLLGLLGLLSFASFMVLTRMHERYLAPAIPFLALAAAKNKQLWPIYFLVSLGHIINMYDQWWFPNIPALVPVVSQWGMVVLVVVILSLSWISWMAVYFNENKT